MRAWPLALTALGACFVPSHRFDERRQPDGGVTPDAAVLTFIAIPSGVSIQGGEGGASAQPPSFDSQPVHRVFTSGYEITTCVSEGEYGACVAAGACPEPPQDGGQRGLGRIFSSHASAYCAWIGARLPTEAELERAVRGDTGATTTTNPSPHGLGSCDLGSTNVWTGDRYKCDAYVNRAWADPQETTAAAPLARLFETDPPAPLPGRFIANWPVYGIRCARTVDTSAPPAPPVQPTCTGSCDVSSLAVGERFGCALRADGSVWCWGSNLHAELGAGDVVDAMPASTAKPAIASGAVEIAAGTTFACARTSAGNVQCWGDNSAGQIGGSTLPMSNTPIGVVTGATVLAAAGSHACAILSDTSISCWGRGGAVAAGTGSTTPTAIGITGATAIAAGERSECAIVGASVRCWGVIHDAGGTQGFISPSSARTFSIAATQIAAGDTHWCAVVGTNVQCWGDRALWNGGSGIAASPETVTGTFVAPKVFVARTGTVILDQGAIVLNTTALPGTLAVDGDAIAFAPSMDSSGCATVGTGASCFGIERGQLGRSNGCDATPSTNALTLP